MKTLPSLLLLGSLLHLTTNITHAATATWISGNGDWATGANWTGGTGSGGAPGTADAATLGNVTTGTRTVTVTTSTATAGNLNLGQTSNATNLLDIQAGGTLSLLTNPASGVGATWGTAASGGGTSEIDIAGSLLLTDTNTSHVTNLAINQTIKFGAGNGTIDRQIANLNAAINYTFNGSVTANAGTGNTAKIQASLGTGANNVVTSVFNGNLNVSSGTLMFYSNMNSGNKVSVNVSTAGQTTIGSGATVTLSVAKIGSNGVSFTNTGTGTLTHQGTYLSDNFGNNAAATSTIINNGTWIVSGASAAIQKSNQASGLSPTFSNTGTLKGSGAADTLTYTDLRTAANRLALSNTGTIAPGAGSAGSLLSSVGTLSLVNVSVTNGSASTLSFDLGGTTGGQFDVLNLTGTGTTLTLNGALDLRLVNGYTPTGHQTFNIITGGSTLSGAFSSLLVNGAIDPQYTFSYAGGVGTVDFTAAVVPEPGTWAMMLGGLAFLFVWGKRNREVLAAK